MMMRSKIDISGLPYFPGVAVGKLQRGMDAVSAGDIMLLEQDEITHFTTLPAGFIVADAAPFSHTLISMLGMGVPTVLISTQQAAGLKKGLRLMIDGNSGRITTNFSARDTAQVDRQNRPITEAGRAVLLDNDPVNLCASVRHPALARLAVENGAAAIGLVRTEYLLPADGAVPDIHFYRQAFREVCEAASPLVVTYRLLDVAVDKIPDWLPHPKSAGRVLGLQGVRLYSMDPVGAVIAAQLAALAELAESFPLRLLIPFLVRLEELEYWQTAIRQRLSRTIPIGAMAETPAIILEMARLVECADFVAIGCNDLMQALFAADRDQAELRHYLDPYAPLLYRFFRQVAEQAGEHLCEVQLCGVLSQLQGVFPVLLGLGYRSFSVDAPFVPYLADIVAGTNQAECERLAAEVCTAGTTLEVLEILRLPTDRHLPFLH